MLCGWKIEWIVRALLKECIVGNQSDQAPPNGSWVYYLEASSLSVSNFIRVMASTQWTEEELTYRPVEVTASIVQHEKMLLSGKESLALLHITPSLYFGLKGEDKLWIRNGDAYSPIFEANLPEDVFMVRRELSHKFCLR